MEKKKKIGIQISIIAILFLGAALFAINNDNENKAESESRVNQAEEKAIQAEEEYIQILMESNSLHQEFLELSLTLCNTLESSSDYQRAISATSNRISEINDNLTEFELQGYSDHPKLGPMITETRELLQSVDFCFNELALHYE